ncbi:MAG: hypothetical protein AB7J47_24110 [Acidimicrobiia bacterium]
MRSDQATGNHTRKTASPPARRSFRIGRAGYDWAYRDQDVAYALRLIEQAVEALVDVAIEAGQSGRGARRDHLRIARAAGNDELYRWRIGVEHQTGDHAGIVAACRELSVYLADLDASPSPAATGLVDELTRRHQP